MIWFTSDWHDKHANVIEFCKRPFIDVYEMRSVLVERFNKRVRPGDTTYFVGDMCFGDFESSKELLMHLNGTKILIQGNHDKFSHPQYLAMGFAAVYEEAVIRLFGRRIRLSHYPRRPSWLVRLFNKRARGVRYMDRRVPADGRWLIHGHSHSTNQVNVERKEIHVGVDAWDYNPVSQREVESLIARSEKK